MEMIDVSPKRIYALNLKYEYNSLKVLRALRENDNTIYEECNEQFITFIHPMYPKSLMCLRKPPTCLFYEGSINLLNTPCIGIIGSRENSEYGEAAVKAIMKEIPIEYTVVSGMAKGIDGIAHRESIRQGRNTIGVIGSGLKYVYPKSNESLFHEVRTNHLLISEYVYDEPILQQHFVERNRIIAALSDILIVVESKLHSGTSITVKEMLELGKEVYVVPHTIFSETGKGNLKMIEDGANVLWNLEEFGKMLKNDLTNTKKHIRLKK